MPDYKKEKAKAAVKPPLISGNPGKRMAMVAAKPAKKQKKGK